MKMLSASSCQKVGRPAGDKFVDDTTRALPSWKRAVDLAFCLLLLPAFVFFTLVAFMLTRAFSPGPIFFRQERVGYRGRRFPLYKFRTMHVSAETASHQAHFAELVKAGVPMQKLDRRGDSRLIPGGWLFRTSGLDELPQLINVLRGEMSLVGPRPCIPYEYGQYSPSQRRRFEAVPGLTGLWQVSGKNRTTFDEMIRLDIEYARTRSPRLDAKIIVRTLPALLEQIADTRKAQRAAKEAKAAIDTVVPFAVH